jgi:hypothetical protein
MMSTNSTKAFEYTTLPAGDADQILLTDCGARMINGVRVALSKFVFFPAVLRPKPWKQPSGKRHHKTILLEHLCSANGTPATTTATSMNPNKTL